MRRPGHLIFALCLIFAIGPQPAVAQSGDAATPPVVDSESIDNPKFENLMKDIDRLRGTIETLSPSQEALDLLKGAAGAPASEPDLTVLLFAEAGGWTAKYSDHDGVAISGAPVILPLGAAIDVRAVSADLLYEMRFPKLGLSFNAIPGRIAAVSFDAKTIGDFQGDCSICGSDGAPLLLRIVEKAQFDDWIASRRGARE